MKWRPTVFVLATAFLAVFVESSFVAFRRIFGVQIDLLPPLMVYTSLTMGFPTIVLLAICGGLWFDSLSLNALGVSILPLLLIGVCIFRSRELLMREHLFAQITLGLIAGVVQPLGMLFLLLNIGAVPLLGWGILWQIFVMAIGSAAVTPLFFKLFDRLYGAFEYKPAVQTSFRPDREIKRGRD
jgi:hypothetical protein